MMTRLQLALDLLEIQPAEEIAEKVANYFDYLEVGTPLIKSEGMSAVRRLKKKFPDKVIVADMKTMDAGRIEVEMAINNGADLVAILGVADDKTIIDSIKTAHEHGKEIMVDLINHPNMHERARQVLKWGADYILFHAGLDQQARGVNIISHLPDDLPAEVLAVAGGLNSSRVEPLVEKGIGLLIIGGAVTRNKDPVQEAKKLRQIVEKYH